MKKVVLSAIALFVGAVGFSQVTDGDGNSSTDPTVIAALPGAGAGANTGLSEQYGNGQRVRVRQAGTRQSAKTYQDNGVLGGFNQAYVRQTGAVGPNSGVRNAAEAFQSGERNSSWTQQEGDRNKALTRQGYNDGGASSFNKAYIRQGVANQAERNFAQVDQDGQGNLASTVQTYDNNDAWTQQEGTDNKSMIRQNGGPNGTAGHYASVQQEGLGNESTVMQSGAGARNTAYSLQVGELNQAKQMQSTSAATGTGNRAGLIQGSLGHTLGTIFANIIPTGDAIRTEVANFDARARPIYVNSLESFGARAKQVQDGFRNEADALQSGGLGAGQSNYAEQDQDDASSSRNQAGITQGWLNWYGGTSDNYAKQFQRGDRNVAGLVQEGNGNKALQNQQGSRNKALSFQIGSVNKLNIHQRGDRNRANSTQSGFDNRALMVQHDGQSYTVIQGISGAGFGDTGGWAAFNQADILQVGPNGNFGPDYAIDCDFDPQMPLDMDFDVPMVMNPDICTDCN